MKRVLIGLLALGLVSTTAFAMNISDTLVLTGGPIAHSNNELFRLADGREVGIDCNNPKVQLFTSLPTEVAVDVPYDDCNKIYNMALKSSVQDPLEIEITGQRITKVTVKH